MRKFRSALQAPSREQLPSTLCPHFTSIQSHPSRGCFWIQDPFHSPTAGQLFPPALPTGGSSSSLVIAARWGEIKSINLRGCDVPVPSAADSFYSLTEQNPEGSGRPLQTLAAKWQQHCSAPGLCLCQQLESREHMTNCSTSRLTQHWKQEGLAGSMQAARDHSLHNPSHPLQQLPLQGDPQMLPCWRTHLEPEHSASPDPALSCGKICSWTQNHTVLE